MAWEWCSDGSNRVQTDGVESMRAMPRRFLGMYLLLAAGWWLVPVDLPCPRSWTGPCVHGVSRSMAGSRTGGRWSRDPPGCDSHLDSLRWPIRGYRQYVCVHLVRRRPTTCPDLRSRRHALPLRDQYPRRRSALRARHLSTRPRTLGDLRRASQRGGAAHGIFGPPRVAAGLAGSDTLYGRPTAGRRAACCQCREAALPAAAAQAAPPAAAAQAAPPAAVDVSKLPPPPDLRSPPGIRASC